MEWNALLSTQRLNSPNPKPTLPHDSRNAFEQDYSRVVFSSAVRRLQDKAQVFPLESGGNVRTRLTHSMEVSSIARSLGVSVESELIQKGLLSSDYQGSFGPILSTAGLIHDLGNPPFGHYGEHVIQRFFKALFQTNLELNLTEAEKEDFRRYDGNAQALRYCTRLHYLYDRKGEINGYDLTCATLATLIKYPRHSLEVRTKKALSYKKIGYFQSEKAKFSAIQETTGIGTSRHPLVFLLEAADDIAYIAADIEDGYKKGAITLIHIIEALEKFPSATTTTYLNRLCNSHEKSYFKRIHHNYPDKEELVIQWFRIDIQRILIQAAIENFITLYDDIIAGQCETELLGIGDASGIFKALKTLGFERIYNHKSSLTKELAGGKAIEGLLERFTYAILNHSNDPEALNLYQLISPNYRFIAETFPSSNTLYDRLFIVTDFIGGMTDSYAIELYQKLSGIRL